MRRSSKLYGLLAAIGLLTMFWLFDITQRPGTQWFAAIGMGVLATVTVRCTARLAQALTVEDQAKVASRWEVRDGR